MSNVNLPDAYADEKLQQKINGAVKDDQSVKAVENLRDSPGSRMGSRHYE